MKRGFTLIELMVSVAIFSVVMTLALGSLLSISTAERKAETIRTAVSNLSFALDSMTRSIRTGINYHCGISGTVTSPQDCGYSGDNPYSSGQPYFAFQGIPGSLQGCAQGTVCTVEYQLVSTASGCGQTGATAGCIKRRITNTASYDSGWLQITSPDVFITNLTFYTIGSCASNPSSGCNSGAADAFQPKVAITLSGYAQVSDTQQSAFNIQTTVTQRVFDQ
ncbi:MAG TPA: type II secretion system protein [Candidatus Paceibacterota bacterium]|nr:type II secretion system protein [Candidatus Paceibacterota bacterium]